MVILYSANNWKSLWLLICGFNVEVGIESLAIYLVHKWSLHFPDNKALLCIVLKTIFSLAFFVSLITFWGYGVFNTTNTAWMFWFKYFEGILIWRILVQTRLLLLTWVQKKDVNNYFPCCSDEVNKGNKSIKLGSHSSIHFCLFCFLLSILYSLTLTMMWIINFLMNSVLFSLTCVLLSTNY